jgi:hypothetical protein
MGRCSILAAAMFAALAPAFADEAQFRAAIGPVSAEQARRMTGVSWNDSCPVAPAELATLRLTHRGFDGGVHNGVLVVHRRVAAEVTEIFRELFAAGFPIERMTPYETFPVEAYAAHNATVGFYCRPAQDDPDELSWHAYGLAIDINPMTNPFDDPKAGWWPKGSDASRDRAAPGLLDARSPAVAIFLRHGWAWGGFEEHVDYMHFAKITIGRGSNPLDRPVWAERLGPPPD